MIKTASLANVLGSSAVERMFLFVADPLCITAFLLYSNPSVLCCTVVWLGDRLLQSPLSIFILVILSIDSIKRCSHVRKQPARSLLADVNASRADVTHAARSSASIDDVKRSIGQLLLLSDKLS